MKVEGVKPEIPDVEMFDDVDRVTLLRAKIANRRAAAVAAEQRRVEAVARARRWRVESQARAAVSPGPH